MREFFWLCGSNIFFYFEAIFYERWILIRLNHHQSIGLHFFCDIFLYFIYFAFKSTNQCQFDIKYNWQMHKKNRDTKRFVIYFIDADFYASNNKYIDICKYVLRLHELVLNCIKTNKNNLFCFILPPNIFL